MIDQSSEQAVIAREQIAAPSLAGRSWTQLTRFIRTKPLGAIGGAIVLVLFVVAALAPVLSPYDPRSTPAAPWEAPNADYLLGADYVGRDVLAGEIPWRIHSSFTVLAFPCMWAWEVFWWASPPVSSSASP